MMSRACGRAMLRASWTVCHGVGRAAASCVASVTRPASTVRCPLPSVARRDPTMRSSMDISGSTLATLETPAQVLARDAERVQEECDPLLELRARDDLIDEAVLEQEFGALKTFRQLLADGLAGHASARESDERARLGEDDVAERRERRQDSACRRICEHTDERNGRLVEASDRGNGLGELHQCDRPLLHPRAAGRGDDDERLAV